MRNGRRVGKPTEFFLYVALYVGTAIVALVMVLALKDNLVERFTKQR